MLGTPCVCMWSSHIHIMFAFSLRVHLHCVFITCLFIVFMMCVFILCMSVVCAPSVCIFIRCAHCRGHEV